MKDLSFRRNPSNGLMEFTKDARGDVLFDETEQHAVMSALVKMRGKWWADTTGREGSQLYLVKTINRITTKSVVEAYAREALADLVSAGRIRLTNVVVELPAMGLAGQIVLAVYWSARGGQPQSSRIFI